MPSILSPIPYSRSQVDAQTTAQSVKARQSARASAGALAPSMASPPTISTGTAASPGASVQTNTALSGTVVGIPWNSTGKWRVLGALPTQYAGTTAFYNGIFATSSQLQPTYAIEWVSDSPDFEFGIRPVNAAPAGWRLMIDGQWAGPYVSSLNSGSKYNVRITNTGRALRRYRLVLDQIGFFGLVVGPTDTVYPTPAPGLRGLVIGDSFAYGQAPTSPGQHTSESWAYLLGQLLGWDETTIGAEGGTGYLRTLNNGKTFEQRLPLLTPVVSAPDIVVVMGSINDQTANNAAFTPTAVGNAATSFYSTLQTTYPKADVFVVGTQPVNGTGGTEETQRDAAILAGASTAQVRKKISMLSPRWITGTGNSGNLKADGNADVMVFSDAVHPTPLHHEQIARRVAGEISSYYAAA